MKYLLNFWWSKELPEVTDHLNDLKGVDKLLFKHMRYYKPQMALKKFVESGWVDEYDYIILASTDIIIEQKNIDMLIEKLEKNKYPVLCGVMNVDMTNNKDKWNITKTIVRGQYEWINKGSLSGVQEVKFNGMTLMAIHRDVFKKYDFYVNALKGIPTDLRFCMWCINEKIPVLTDCDNEMKHLRYKGTTLCGVKSPEIWFKGKKVKLESPNYEVTDLEYEKV